MKFPAYLTTTPFTTMATLDSRIDFFVRSEVTKLLPKASRTLFSGRQVFSPEIPASVSWTWALVSNDDDDVSIIERVPYIAVVLDAAEFLEEVRKGSFLSAINRVMSELPEGFTLCIIIPGLRRLVRTREQQDYCGTLRWDTPDYRLALAQLSTNFCNVHSFACHDNKVAAAHIAKLHQVIDQAPRRRPTTRMDIARNGGLLNKKNPLYQQIKEDTWCKVLANIPGVSIRAAIAIRKVYPSARALLKHYFMNSITEREKEALLQDIEMPLMEGESSAPRKVGPTASKRVFTVLYSTKAINTLYLFSRYA